MTFREEQFPNFEDKAKFVREHSEEIKPLTDDAEFVDAVEKGVEPKDKERMDNILESYENKIFIFENENAGENAKRILFAVDNPGAYNSVKALIKKLKNSNKCASIAVITGGMSNKDFEKEFGDEFKQIRDKDGIFLNDLSQAVSGDRPIDIMIATLSIKNGPESVPLYSGKSVFGAKKTFLIMDGWGGAVYDGSALDRKITDSEAGKEIVSDIDGIFCNDELAKEILKQNFPKFPSENIFDTGTPVFDELDIENAGKHRESGRKKLRLEQNDFAILYIGDAGFYEEFESDREINQKSFEKSFEAVLEVAKKNPDMNFAVLLRPHPRDFEKNKLYEIASRLKLPANLKFIDASKDVLSMNEATCAADVIESIASTENLLAPLRGRPSIFMGFEEKGMGGQVLKGSYKPEILDLIKKTAGVNIAVSKENLEEIIFQLAKNPTKILNENKNLKGEASDRIIEKIYEICGNDKKENKL